MTPKTMLVGCSFTDPVWQKVKPWSIAYSSSMPSYIVAKAGMGIKGICTEALYYLREIDSIEKIVIILPTLWRMDIEMDQETYLCNAMVDLITSRDNSWNILSVAQRKWITSGGLHYDQNTESGRIFQALYRHQGFLVILKEHLRALKLLQLYCDHREIEWHISAIMDPMKQLQGLDYVRAEIVKELENVHYQRWFRFDGRFIDEFLGHGQHPNDTEHLLLNEIIQEQTSKWKTDLP